MGTAPTKPIITKFGVRGLVGDIITGDKFCRDPLRGFRSVGVRKWGLPLTWAVALTTGARCNARLVATGLVICVCDWLRDETGLEFGDRSWICNTAQVSTTVLPVMASYGAMPQNSSKSGLFQAKIPKCKNRIISETMNPIKRKFGNKPSSGLPITFHYPSLS